MWQGVPDKKYLQHRARDIIQQSPEGICGGQLSQKLQAAEGAAVMAIFGQKDGKVQRGWLQGLMRGLSKEVDCVKHGGGRDFMYYLKEGAASPYPAPVYPGASANLFVPTAMQQRYASAIPAMHMKEDDFVGHWLDSLGNNVTVYKNKESSQLTAVLSKAPRKDIVLPMLPEPLGMGWMSWRCGNSVLDLRISTSEQLCWASQDGRMSGWMKDTSKQTQVTLNDKLEDPDSSDEKGDSKSKKEDASETRTTQGDEKEPNKSNK